MRIFDLCELLKICTFRDQKVSDNEFIYNFLCVNKNFILKNSNEFTVEDLWYSEYYYLMCVKNQNEQNFGYDAGFEQMCFKLLGDIENKIDIDWDIIRNLEEKALLNNSGGEVNESSNSKSFKCIRQG